MADLAAALRRHERIGVDTPIFISHIEGTTHLAGLAGVAMDELAGGAFTGVTSVLTLMEIAVKPLHMGRPDVAEEYEVLLANYPNLVIAAIDRPTARARPRCEPSTASAQRTRGRSPPAWSREQPRF